MRLVNYYFRQIMIAVANFIFKCIPDMITAFVRLDLQGTENIYCVL
jgi:hypothetical protein